MMIDADLAELVDQHSHASHAGLVDPVVQQCGLARAQEAGEQADRNAVDRDLARHGRRGGSEIH